MARRSDRPNVLIIMTDQQRRDSLGCYGNPFTRTPNLDRLATDGVRFNRAYCTNPVCMPSRLSLFTGEYVHSHGLWDNGVLIPERTTLADDLSRAGYQTSYFGKVHFTPYQGDLRNRESMNLWRELGDDVSWTGPFWGFEHVELTLLHTENLAHYGKWFRDRGGTEEMREHDPETELRSIPVALHDSTFVAERTVDFLESARDRSRPFLAVASFPDPHHPFNPPKEMAALYPTDRIVEPVGSREDLRTRPPHYEEHYVYPWGLKSDPIDQTPNGVPERVKRQRIANTYAMVDLIDRNVGLILAALDEQGLRENTIVIFTSDHGELLGDHGLWFKGPYYYDSLLNIPLVISSPGCAAGAVTESLISLVDIVPTLHDLLGIEPDRPVDGVSLVPRLTGRSHACRERCLAEHVSCRDEGPVAANVVVTRDAKYVRYSTGVEELTDLSADPDEKKNVAADSGAGELLSRMRGELAKERGEFLKADPARTVSY
jgi:arylsulfatase A-like enzyme